MRSHTKASPKRSSLIHKFAPLAVADADEATTPKSYEAAVADEEASDATATATGKASTTTAEATIPNPDDAAAEN